MQSAPIPSQVVSDAPPLLRLRGLYSERLAPVSLDLAAGECAAVVGASGSGKSLLLRQIADLDPGHGEAELDGRRRSAMRGFEWRRLVMYCQAEAGWWDDHVSAHFADRAGATAIMGRLGLVESKLDALVHELSTGERQRMGLVRALMQNPRVLLLDEPTAALDQEATALVEAELSRVLAAGAGILLVTHSAEQAERLARRRWRMAQGHMEPLWT
ncbi:putative iron export ATP-binding protein FetA [Achromobacter animicus]|uniref:Putative iron export ATP-binding protein FetA n=1 Tax=Achromobacter animicus TaxID=1389935 RepID=A0A6S6Z2G6_9BURK|nr:ABC transporter ATP-binding protein [Achromobacter animicus]CAB3656960.1 putative iron export ATP-binding protein FetA [Achromobacter animicus]